MNMQLPEDLKNQSIYQAALNGNIKVIRQILERGECVDVRDGLGRTPLFYAVQKPQEEAALLLIDMGAEVNMQDDQGKTPMHVAIFCGQNKMVQLLIEHDANLEIKNSMHLSPLSVAVMEGYENIVKLLIDSGCNVNVRVGSSENSDTLLHRAVSRTNLNRSLQIIDLLLSHGADVHAQSGLFGYTPLYYTEDYADFGLSWLLNSRKLSWLLSSRKNEVEELLKQYGASSKKKMYKWAIPMHIVRDILRTCSS